MIVGLQLQEQAARVAQAELEMRMTEAKMKDDEARRLQLELQNARTEMEQNQKALQEVMNAQTHADEDDINSEQSSYPLSLQLTHTAQCWRQVWARTRLAPRWVTSPLDFTGSPSADSLGCSPNCHQTPSRTSPLDFTGDSIRRPPWL